MSRYHMSLIGVFVAVWVWAAIRPLYPHDWFLENVLVFLFVPVVIGAGYYFRLSDTSYTLITVFMALHLVGAHYTYSEVPFGDTLQSWFGADRNMYDRLVHFSFGLLLAYPVREAFLRLAKAKGVWGYILPVELTFALSAIYEIIEWLVAAGVDPEAGIAFLGTQGDVWDAQKDMLLAGSGAALTMFAVALINWRLNRNFLAELKESLLIAPGDAPLGEEKLKEWLKR